MGSGQQCEHLGVVELGEVPVVLTDRPERVRSAGTDHVVGQPLAARDRRRRRPPVRPPARSRAPAPRTAVTAARMVAPVARPSSTTMTIRSSTDGVEPNTVTRARSASVSDATTRARARSDSPSRPRPSGVQHLLDAISDGGDGPDGQLGLPGRAELAYHQHRQSAPPVPGRRERRPVRRRGAAPAPAADQDHDHGRAAAARAATTSAASSSPADGPVRIRPTRS